MIIIKRKSLIIGCILICLAACKKEKAEPVITKENYISKLENKAWKIISVSKDGFAVNNACLRGAIYKFNADSTITIDEINGSCESWSWFSLKPKIWYIDEDFKFVIITEDERAWTITYFGKINYLENKNLQLSFKNSRNQEIKYAFELSQE